MLSQRKSRSVENVSTLGIEFKSSSPSSSSVHKEPTNPKWIRGAKDKGSQSVAASSSISFSRLVSASLPTATAVSSTPIGASSPIDIKRQSSKEDSLTYLSTSAPEHVNVPKILKLDIFDVTRSITDTYIFDPLISVENAIAQIAEAKSLKGKEGEYGLFVPLRSGKQVQNSGWLVRNRTLASYNLSQKIIVEFRLLQRTIHVLRKESEGGKNLALMEIPISDTLPIQELIPIICSHIQPTLIPHITTFNDSEVVELEKEVLLLHLPLPEKTTFVLIDHGALDPSASSQKELLKKYALHFVVPHKSGWLLKKGDVGPMRLWKRRWFALRKDKLYYYKSNTKSQFINYISIQRVNDVMFSNISDPLLPKKHCSFQLNTPGRIYYLAAETTSEAAAWIQTLSQWLKYKITFGPENVKATIKMLKSPVLLNNLASPSSSPSLPVTVTLSAPPIASSVASENSVSESASVNSVSGSASVYTQQIAYSVSALTHAEAANEWSDEEDVDDKTADRPPDMRVIQVLQGDGTLQTVEIDANVEVFDIVAKVSEAIGSHNVLQMTYLDHSTDRTVEMLDNQKSINEQNVPHEAVFIVKKTGILTDLMLNASDLYNNHFLFVQSPQLEGFVLRKRLNFNQKEESSSWQHFWFTLRGHRLSFFLNRLKRHYTHCISLVEMLSIDDTSEAEMNFFNEFNVSCDGCGFQVKLQNSTELYLVKNKEARDKWVATLTTWRRFYRGDGTSTPDTYSFLLQEKRRTSSCGSSIEEEETKEEEFKDFANFFSQSFI